jgi:GT2 family glycosyltransferase
LPVRVVASETNLGYAAANNRAVALLEGCDLVALLNPDAFPEPRWLAALIAAAGNHPEAASFASRQMLDGQPGRLDGAGDVLHVSGLVWRHGHGRSLDSVSGALEPGPVFSACAAAALYRRADWVRAGGFDERFFCYAEDVDLGFRLQLLGRSCRYVPDAVVQHVGSASAGVGSRFAIYHGHRNLEWMFVKNTPAALLWRYLPLHLATWVAGFAWFARRGRAGTYVTAKWDALRGLPPVWRSRRLVRRSAVTSAAEVRKLMNRDSLMTRFGARPS